MKDKTYKNIYIESFDLDCGVYEYVIFLTYGKLRKKYIIYGFSQIDCENNKNEFIKQWFITQKEIAEFIGE